MTYEVWEHYTKGNTKGFGKDANRWPVRCNYCITKVVAEERARQLNVQANHGTTAQTEAQIRSTVVESNNPKPFASRIEAMLKHLADNCGNTPAAIKAKSKIELARYKQSAAERALERSANKENVPPSTAPLVPPSTTPLVPPRNAPLVPASRVPQRTATETTLVAESSSDERPTQRMRTDDYQPNDSPALFEHIVPDAWPRERVVKFAADLCRLMVVCNIAWCSVEHPYWPYFFQEWLPGMPIPGRKELSGRILDEQVELCVADMKARTGGKFATGQCDGWKDMTRKNIIASMWNVEFTPYLVNTDDVSGQPKTAENLLDIVLREIQFALNMLKIIVVAWCTDASGESAKMRRLLVQRMPWIIVLDCWAHQINLVVGDMLKVSSFFTTVVEDALDIVKWFNNHSVALGLLRARMMQCLGKILALVLPILTRWTSHYLCVRRLLEVERPLRELALDPALVQAMGGGDGNELEKVESIVYTLSQPAFWDNLKKARAHLEPLAMAANATQSDCARLDVVLMTIANLFHYFSTTSGLDSPAATAVLASLERRWAKADQDMFLLALIFNPYVRVACFAEDSPFRVPAKVYELAKRAFRRFYNQDPGSDFQNELTDYLQCIGLWTEESMQLDEREQLAAAEGKEVNMVHIWRACAPISSRTEGAVPPSGIGRLCLLAARILSVVPNSAAVERIFSLFGIVHSRLRNRLGVDKARKEVLLKVDTAMRFGRPGTGQKRHWLDDDEDEATPPVSQAAASAPSEGGSAQEGRPLGQQAGLTFATVVQEIMEDLEQETERTPPPPPRPDNARARLLKHLFSFPSGASASNRGLQRYWATALRNLEREAFYHDEHYEALERSAAAAAPT